MSNFGIDTRLSRRNVLAGAALGGAALALSACKSTSSSGSPTPDSGSAVALPQYQALSGIRPDIVGDPAKGIQDGFFSMPDHLVRSVHGAPLSGGRITATVPTLAPPLGSNTYARAVNKALGGTLQINTVPSSDYNTKMGALLAGNDLTDLVLVQWFDQPRLDLLLKGRFADVSDHLSGAHIKDYPNLAGIPTAVWRNARMFGRLWGVPIERPLLWNIVQARPDLIRQAGVDPDSVKTTDDFTAMCKEVTDAKRGRWALAGSYGSFCVARFAAAHGAPNNWGRKADGTLVRDWETPEFTAALEYAAKLRAAGYFHPQSANLTGSQNTEMQQAGKVVMFDGYLAGWAAMVNINKMKPSQVAALPLFAAPGKKPAVYYGTGSYGVTLVKKADDARVRECLRLLDYFAAPFGTEEYLLTHYGVKGVDYTSQKGQPVLTDRGTLEAPSVGYLSGASQRAIYNSDHPDLLRAQHAWQVAVAPYGLADPTVGLYSETANRGGDAQQKVTDTITDVAMGRKGIGSFTSAVKAWKSAAGDRIRDEYQKQLA